MADRYDEEYEFTDPDMLNAEMAESQTSSVPPASQTLGAVPGRKNVKRNALITLGVVLFFMLAYKFFTSIPTPDKSGIVPIAPIQQVQPIVTAPPVAVVQPVAENPELMQRVSAMELSQQNLRTEITAVSDQLNTLNNSAGQVMPQLEKLNQTLTEMAEKMEAQAQQIIMLTEKFREKKQVVHHRPVRSGPPAPVFYLQAIIPGRAWLINTAGNTLTVREGTSVPGYGMVKIIDAVQGRVLFNSGKIMRFSQQDS